MLSDNQTSVFEGLSARVSDLIRAVHQLTDALRQVPMRPSDTAQTLTPWDEIEATLRHLQALERCHTAFQRSPTDELADSPPIRQLYAQQLRLLQEQLHGLAGTPVEGYIADA
jgi:hypothetical protein